MLACIWRISTLPVLTYPKVRSAPDLEPRPVWSLRAHLRFLLSLTYPSCLDILT